MRPRYRKRHFILFMISVQCVFYTFIAKIANIRYDKITFSVISHSDHPVIAGHHVLLQQIAALIDHQNRLRRKVSGHLHFRLSDALPASQVFDMGYPDGGDDGDIRAHHIRQHVNLTPAVHAHFQHSNLQILIERQDRQRQAEFIVVVFLVSARLIAGGRHIIEHVSGAGLAHAAGDGNLFFQRQSRNVILRKLLKGPQGVRHQNHADVVFFQPHFPQNILARHFFYVGDDQQPASPFQHISQIIMAVCPGSLHRKEAVFRCHLSGIDACTPHEMVHTSLQQSAAGLIQYFLYRDVFHVLFSPV